jgi:hypothetical protein
VPAAEQGGKLLQEREELLGSVQPGAGGVSSPRATTPSRKAVGADLPRKGHRAASPQPWCRLKLAEGLKVSVEELDRMLAEGQSAKAGLTVAAADEPCDNHDHDLVLTAPWSHRGTVEAAVMLSGGGDSRVKRRVFLSLSGTALTAPAHQWLVHEPEPLVSGLAGRRVSAKLADRLPPMIAELRAMDDVAGGGMVLSLAQTEFGWVAGLLDQASYDESTGRKLLAALAELGQLVSWVPMTTGSLDWRSDITSQRCERRTAQTTALWARTSLVRWRSKPLAKGYPLKP